MAVFEWFSALNPVRQALLATLFTWLMTALGGAPVFFFRKIERNAALG